MGSKEKRGLENILQSLENYIEPTLDKLRFDKTYKAKVITNKGDGLYTAQINGKQYDLRASSSELLPGTIVYAKAPLNNFSDIYIETSGVGGGAINYENLINKPSINNVELIGNKSLANLGIQPAGNYIVDNDYVHTDNNYTDADKAIVDSYTALDVLNKIKTVDGTGSGLDADLLDGQHSTYFEAVGNKVTSISGTSTDVQYPSAKLLYDQITPVNNSVSSLLNERELTLEPTGFTNNENITVNYNSTTRQVTLTGTFQAYYKGVLVSALTNGWVSPAHADVAGTYYLYYDGSTFQFSTVPWTYDKIQIAFVQYGTNNLAVKETHGFMQWQSHRELHNTIGAYKESGGVFNNFTPNSTTPANRRPDITALVLNDEDLRSTVNALTTKAYTQRTLTGSAVRTLTTNATEILPVSGSTPYYNLNTNGVWSQALMTNNNYAAIFVVGIPTTADTQSQLYRYMFIQPQQIGTLDVINSLTPANLTLGDVSNFVSEFVFFAKIVIEYSGNDWRITSISDIKGNVLTITQTTTTTHNSLSGLQGGGIAEYYHITAAQNIVVGNTSGVNTGDETNTTIKTKLGAASAINDGYLTSANWTTFNNKQNALTADVDYLTPGTASTTYEPKKGTDDNYVTDAEKLKIGNLPSDTNTALGLKADLVDGKVPASQLPAFVDDVLEFANLAAFPVTGEGGKIYIAMDTNRTYRWTGTGYAEISESLALGETSSTAYRGDRGKTAYDHTFLTNNPHSVTKAQVGLGNCDNTADVLKPVATQTTNGIMSSTDKAKLDGIAVNANNYVLPVASTSLGGIKSGTDITVDGSGNVSVVDDSHAHTKIKSIDDRDRKPADTTKGNTESTFMSLGGMTGAADNDYQDMLVLNTYADVSGGKVNALVFDKSEMKIRHYQASQTDTTWGVPKVLAYNDVVTQTTNGLMSSTDKTKLDGIEVGAQVNDTTSYVPYTNATKSVDLNTQRVYAGTEELNLDSEYQAAETTLSGTSVTFNNSTGGFLKSYDFEGNSTQVIKTGYIRNGLVVHYDGVDSENYSLTNTNTSANKAVWKDLSGNAKNGTLTNFNYNSTSGWLSNGLKFDGTNDYVVLDNPNIFSSDFTIEINIKSPSVIGSYIVYSLGETTGKLFLFFRSTGYITLGSNAPVDGIRWQIGTYIVNTNYNIVIKRTSDQIKAYVNNVEYTPTSQDNGSFITALNSVILTDKIYLGVYNSNNVFSLYLPSTINSFRIYNRSVTTTEATNNYNIDVSRFVNNDLKTYSVYDVPCSDYPSNIYNVGDNNNLTLLKHGKNMFDLAIGTVTVNGVTCTTSIDGTITLNGTSTGSGTISLSGQIASGFPSVKNRIIMANGLNYTLSRSIISGTASVASMAIGSLDTSGVTTYPTGYLFNFNFNSSSSGTQTLTAGTPLGTGFSSSLLSRGVFLSFNAAGIVYNNYKIKIQFEQNTTATAYEPYQGAEYPITLPSGYIGGSLPNLTVDTYDYVVGGKNLYNKTTITSGKYLNNLGQEVTLAGWYISDYIDISNLNDITLSPVTGTSAALCFYDIDKVFISGTAYGGDKSFMSFSVPDNAVYTRFAVYTYSINNTQLEAGTVATDIQPYGLQSGNYLIKKIDKFVLNGSETYSSLTNSTDGYKRFAYTNTLIKISDFNQVCCYSDKFLGVSLANNTTTTTGYKNLVSVVNASGVLAFRTTSTTYTVTDFKNFLASNNVTVYYPLAMPVYTPITLPQIEMYETPTTITSTNSVLPTINATYSVWNGYSLRIRNATETKAYIDYFGKIGVTSAVIGGSTNNLLINTNGSLTFNGTSRFYNTTRKISGKALEVSSIPPTSEITGYVDYEKYTIGDTSVFTDISDLRRIQYSNINVKILWVCLENYATNSGEVQWQVQWSTIAKDGGGTLAVPQYTGTVKSGDVNIPTNSGEIKETVISIPGTNIDRNNIIGFSLSRVALDGGNNPTVEPGIIEVLIEMAHDNLGASYS